VVQSRTPKAKLTFWHRQRMSVGGQPRLSALFNMFWIHMRCGNAQRLARGRPNKKQMDARMLGKDLVMAGVISGFVGREIPTPHGESPVRSCATLRTVNKPTQNSKRSFMLSDFRGATSCSGA